MISELPTRWIFCAIVVYVAMRCLVAMALLLRDRLQGLLAAHVKAQQIQAKKRERIMELRQKIRAKKASIADTNSAKVNAQEKRAA